MHIANDRANMMTVKERRCHLDLLLHDRQFDCLDQGDEPACSAFMTAHLLQQYGIRKDPMEIYDRIGRFGDSEAVAPWQVAEYINGILEEQGLSDRYGFEKRCTLQDIRSELAQGRAVPVVILYDTEDRTFDDLHYVLVTGLDEQTVYLVDSLHDTGRRSYNRTVSLDDFRIMWSLKNFHLPVGWIGFSNMMLKEG